MSVVTIGLDLAKTAFQVHGDDEKGVAVLRRKLARADMITFFTKQPVFASISKSIMRSAANASILRTRSASASC